MKHVNTDSNNKNAAVKTAGDLEADMLQKTKELEAEPAPSLDIEIDDSTLAADVVEALREIYDPEIPVNIYDLGLIYKVLIDQGNAEVDMTLTTPGCPVAQSFPGMVEATIKKVPGIQSAKVNLVWDPPWTQDQLSEEARLQLVLI